MDKETKFWRELLMNAALWALLLAGVVISGKDDIKQFIKERIGYGYDANDAGRIKGDHR